MAPDPSIVTATEDLDCDDCGLSIHPGDHVVLGRHGWVHPTCGELEAAADQITRPNPEGAHDEA